MNKSNKSNSKGSMEQKSVVFVEQTKDGEPGKRLREVITRLAPILRLSIKVVERPGGTLKSRLPKNIWEGAKCGREKCITCNQDAEFYIPCTRKSAVYENICSKCNIGAGNKEEVVGATLRFPQYMREKPHGSSKRGGRTALSRQTAEAMRIGKRGAEGAMLNSRSEFNRCFIPVRSDYVSLVISVRLVRLYLLS